VTAVLVHGVTDTPRLWDGVRAHLTRDDIIALALPGFDSPVPDGFGATKEEYADWIVGELEAIGEPVDLVGHDWGCILTARVASVRPDLVRTWAGGGGPVSAAYAWHSLALVWQAEGEGEAWSRNFDPEGWAAIYAQFGVPLDTAREAAALVDETMRSCILALYRSAVELGREWEPGLADATCPALVVWGEHDATTPIEYGERLAASLRADALVRLDAQHFFPIERPAETAAALEAFWARH
jgi:pimeloyl-ACP methyl ester carboxylesterase